MKLQKSILYSLVLLGITSQTIQGMQKLPVQAIEEAKPYQLRLGGSKEPWYTTVTQRIVANPIKLEYDNQSDTPVFIVQQGINKDYSWVHLSPKETYGEEYFDMDKLVLPDGIKRPSLTIGTGDNRVYTVNFEKMDKYTPSAPYFSAVVDQIDNPASLAPLNIKDEKNLNTKYFKETFVNRAEYDLPKTRIQQLDNILHGAIISVIIDKNKVSLGKK